MLSPSLISTTRWTIEHRFLFFWNETLQFPSIRISSFQLPEYLVFFTGPTFAKTNSPTCFTNALTSHHENTTYSIRDKETRGHFVLFRLVFKETFNLFSPLEFETKQYIRVYLCGQDVASANECHGQWSKIINILLCIKRIRGLLRFLRLLCDKCVSLP